MSRKSDLYILSEQYAKVYEGTGTVQPEGDASAINMGPGGVIEVQPDGQYPEPPRQQEDALNQMSGDLLARLEDMSESFGRTGDDISIGISNLATRVLGLLQGVDRYSKANPQVGDKQKELLIQIGELVTQLPSADSQEEQ